MERRVSIVLDDREKQILHQAAEIMQSACVFAGAGERCIECPFVRLCDNNLEHGKNLAEVAEHLLNI